MLLASMFSPNLTIGGVLKPINSLTSALFAAVLCNLRNNFIKVHHFTLRKKNIFWLRSSIFTVGVKLKHDACLLLETFSVFTNAIDRFWARLVGNQFFNFNIL